MHLCTRAGAAGTRRRGGTGGEVQLSFPAGGGWRWALASASAGVAAMDVHTVPYTHVRFVIHESGQGLWACLTMSGGW